MLLIQALLSRDTECRRQNKQQQTGAVVGTSGSLARIDWSVSKGWVD